MFSTEVESALAFASTRHAKQTRKGTNVPYFVHLVHVAFLMVKAGGGDDAIIVALLHDVVEDTAHSEAERQTLLDEIRATWGYAVANAVHTLTEPQRSADGQRLPWRARKEAYVRQLEVGAPLALRVSAADKVHNLETLLDSLDAEGELVWRRFQGGPKDSRWFYGEVHRVLSERLEKEDPLIHSLAAAIARLDRWIGQHLR